MAKPASASRSPKRREVVGEDRRPPEKSSRQILHRRGVVVGIGAYPNQTLENASRDGKAVAEILAEDYSFLPTLLLDGAATRDAIENAIHASLAGADDATQWIFYFAGHGKREDGKGYLLPVGGKGDDLATCLPLSTLLEICDRSPCGEILIILDACYAGQALLRPEELSDALDRDPDKSRRVRQILCAGNPDQRVIDGGGEGHSVFTQCLLEALNGWAGIHDGDGRIHFRDLLKFLQDEVGKRLDLQKGEDPQIPFGEERNGRRRRRQFLLPKHSVSDGVQDGWTSNAGV